MTFVAYSAPLINYFLGERNGITIADPTTVGECLVSDLQVGDFLWGPRSEVTALGTAATTRSVTLERSNGVSYTTTFVSASSLRIVR